MVRLNHLLFLFPSLFFLLSRPFSVSRLSPLLSPLISPPPLFSILQPSTGHGDGTLGFPSASQVLDFPALGLFLEP